MTRSGQIAPGVDREDLTRRSDRDFRRWRSSCHSVKNKAIQTHGARVVPDYLLLAWFVTYECLG